MSERKPSEMLLCVRCKYDLSGLDPSGSCPECACPVSYSIRNRRQPLTPQNRLLFIGYTTAWVVVVVSPFALPPLAGALGMKVITGWGGIWSDVLIGCAAATLVCGIALLVVLARRNHWLTTPVAISLVPLLGVIFAAQIV